MTDPAQLEIPDAPSKRGSEPTSAEAGHRIATKAATLRERVLNVLTEQRGDFPWCGMTADEVAHRLGESVLSTRPRISELKRAGLIRATGERRVNASGLRAAVWVAV